LILIDGCRETGFEIDKEDEEEDEEDEDKDEEDK
jgi:hypothetical protein